MDSTNAAVRRPGRLASVGRAFSGLVDGLSTVYKGLDTVYKIVVAVGLLAGLTGTGLVIVKPQPTPSPAVAQPTPSPAVASVPNVYNVASDQAMTLLTSGGYRPRSIEVCSGSVGADRVRQVLTDIGATDGTILVDAQGVTAAGRSLAKGTAVVVKVSTGKPCV